MLVVLLLHGHVWGSIRVHHLWARPCFSSSVLHVCSPFELYVYIDCNPYLVLFNHKLNVWSHLMRRRVCFVLRHINLIGHIMPNQVKENKSEKKFKGEVSGINDKLLIICYLFIFFIRSLFVGNHDHKKTPKNSESCWGRDQFVKIYLLKKGFIEVIWSYCKFLEIFVYNFTVFSISKNSQVIHVYYHIIYFSVLEQFLHIIAL